MDQVYNGVSICGPGLKEGVNLWTRSKIECQIVVQA